MEGSSSETRLERFDLKRFADELLGFIERQEERLLSWGFYHVLLEPEELEILIEDAAPEGLQQLWELGRSTGLELGTVMDQMERAGLLYRPSMSQAYRSRFAEGIRLLARLRQVFKPADWSNGPTLVSDVRVHLSPRHYPRRDQAASDCWNDLRSHCKFPAVQGEAFTSLASGPAEGSMTFAGFQRRAFRHVLSKYRARGLSGTVVSAGTGSGKTKAFYIPAFLGVIADLAADPAPYTKIIAIYPRNVLLADQLREALSEAAKLRPVLAKSGLRQITFGALLGDTPYDAEKVTAWERAQDGYVVPFAKAPDGRDLVWRDADRSSGKTALYVRGAGTQDPLVPDGVLTLTRDALRRQPPDVLFLSVEMLNREMGNPAWSSTFGIGVATERAPRMLLLDEVHAYEGVKGAQIAWVLRRWRHWASIRSLHVVGLSATLKDAPKHVGLIADVQPTLITEFRPEQGELTTESMEYNVALKWDSGSGASVLATTLQAGMLLNRLLTPRSQPANDGEAISGSAMYGRKVFGFTDSLDGLNRWFGDMVDAERKHLAALRLPPETRRPPQNVPASVRAQMERDGQIWSLPRQLDHDLSKSLHVGRCSSQDPGASAGDDLIIATSSLEVGYDDPLVGAILHHKKPISIASFIQRKGRAGRTRGTRPWTVVVLSDYGGDRWAFQNIESLFQPEIEATFLPVRNPYVLRIQATYFLVDWLGRRVGESSPFSYLAHPGRNRAGVVRAVLILRDILARGSEWQRFRRELSRAFGSRKGSLGLSNAMIDGLLWGAPRSLMLHVIPTLLRKLEVDWRFADPERAGQIEDARANRPLPEFLPGATFSDLELNEARLSFAGRPPEDDESLPSARFLREIAPGRVSKRYAKGIGERGYWLSYSERLVGVDGKSTASVGDFFPNRALVTVVNGTAVFQPLEAQVVHRPERILDTSNAFWQWETSIRPLTDGHRLPVFTGEVWSRVFRDCRAHLHANNGGLEVLRYARSCKYEIAAQRGDGWRGTVVLEGTPNGGVTPHEAVGFRLRADGISIRVAAEFLASVPRRPRSELARLRVDYFLDRIRSSDALEEKANSFQAEWLWRTSVSMLAATAVRRRLTVEQSVAALEGRRPEAARRVLESVLRSQAVGADGDGGDARRTKEIVDLWRDPAIVTEIGKLERECLWADIGPEFENWLRRRFVATLAQAFRAAVVGRHGDVAEEDLLVDVLWHEDGSASIHLAEANSGGLGQIELLVDELRRAPDLFHDGFRHSLAFCPREHTGSALGTLLEDVVTAGDGDAIRGAFSSVRSASGFQALNEAKEELRTSLEDAGFPASRSFVVSVVTRFLRPGSISETDTMTALLNRALRRARERAGIAIDHRVFAYLCVEYPPAERRLAQAMRRMSGGEVPTRAQLYAIIQQLLVPECLESCPDCLDNPNRFNLFGSPARSLACDWLGLTAPVVRVSEQLNDWILHVRRHLVERARVSLVASDAELPAVGRALQSLLLEEVAVGYLLLPISVAGVAREGRSWTITLQLREATHGE